MAATSESTVDWVASIATADLPPFVSGGDLDACGRRSREVANKPESGLNIRSAKYFLEALMTTNSACLKHPTASYQPHTCESSPGISPSSSLTSADVHFVGQ